MKMPKMIYAHCSAASSRNRCRYDVGELKRRLSGEKPWTRHENDETRRKRSCAQSDVGTDHEWTKSGSSKVYVDVGCVNDGCTRSDVSERELHYGFGAGATFGSRCDASARARWCKQRGVDTKLDARYAKMRRDAPGCENESRKSLDNTLFGANTQDAHAAQSKFSARGARGLARGD